MNVRFWLYKFPLKYRLAVCPRLQFTDKMTTKTLRCQQLRKLSLVTVLSACCFECCASILQHIGTERLGTILNSAYPLILRLRSGFVLDGKFNGHYRNVGGAPQNDENIHNSFFVTFEDFLFFPSCWKNENVVEYFL